MLLNEFKWDKDRLLERFYDNPEKLFKDHDILYNPEPDNIDIEVDLKSDSYQIF